MIIRYISDTKIVLEATEDEVQRIRGDANYTPQAGDTVDVNKNWATYNWIMGKKDKIRAAGENMNALADALEA